MRKKQLIALCICNIVIFMGISALVGLMPVYLTQLGADSTQIGFFLAFAFLSLAISTVVTGRLSDRLQRRKFLLFLGGALAIPIALLMSGVTSVVGLMILMCCLWFVTGSAVTMINTLTGLFSEPGSRGRLFGILSLSAGFGLFIGSLVSGQVADRWGYPALFVLSALLYLTIPIAGLFVEDKVVARLPTEAAAPTMGTILAQRTFLFLFIANILAQASNSIIFLSRPLIMDTLHFDAVAISGASAIGSLITLPLPLVVGWLADRIGRKSIIVGCFFAPMLGLIVLAASVDLWHFWVTGVLSTMLGASMVVASALVTDSFSEESLGTALAMLNATPWIGIVIGLGGGGVAIRAIEMTPTLILGVLLSLIALLLLIPISTHKPEYQQQTV